LSNRRLEFTIGGFLLLLALSLIGWNVALTYNLPIYTVIGIMIGTFGFFLIGIVLTSDDQ